MAIAPLSPPFAHEPSVPAAYALQVVKLAGRWSVSPGELLEGSSLTASELEEPSARIPLAAMNALVSRARALTGEPGLGFYMGLQKRISMYGFLGFAIMTAGTVRECLELAVRFTPTLTTALSLHLTVPQGPADGAYAALVVEPLVDMGDVHDIATISLLVGISQIGSMLTGRELDGFAEVDFPEPPYYARFAHVAPNVRFGQPLTRVLFDASLLDLPIVMADRAALRLAQEQCERQLEALGFDAQLGERVRRALPTASGFRSLDEVAAHLHLSRRTLTRRLVAQGLSFSVLLDRERRERALILLRSDASLEAISERLGYSTVPSFTRAFHRWTAMTPGAYRRIHCRPAVRAAR